LRPLNTFTGPQSGETVSGVSLTTEGRGEAKTEEEIEPEIEHQSNRFPAVTGFGTGIQRACTCTPAKVDSNRRVVQLELRLKRENTGKIWSRTWAKTPENGVNNSGPFPQFDEFPSECFHPWRTWLDD